MKLDNKVYDVLKYIVTIGLPALATFLGVLLPTCGVATETVKMILTIVSALTAFIGTLIGISTVAYNSERK